MENLNELFGQLNIWLTVSFPGDSNMPQGLRTIVVVNQQIGDGVFQRMDSAVVPFKRNLAKEVTEFPSLRPAYIKPTLARSKWASATLSTLAPSPLGSLLISTSLDLSSQQTGELSWVQLKKANKYTHSSRKKRWGCRHNSTLGVGRRYPAFKIFKKEDKVLLSYL